MTHSLGVGRLGRGFKTWAENTAVEIRGRLGLAKTAPLVPHELARHLGVRLWTPGDVPGLSVETLRYLVSPDGDEWSAVTMRLGGCVIVVFNPSHSQARQANDIMHELAHVLRGHAPSRIVVFAETGINLRVDDLPEGTEAKLREIADRLMSCKLVAFRARGREVRWKLRGKDDGTPAAG